MSLAVYIILALIAGALLIVALWYRPVETDKFEDKVIELLAKRRIREGLEAQDNYEKEVIQRLAKRRVAL